MLKTVDEKGNIIYGDLSLQENLKLEFKGSNNIVFFAGSSLNANIIFQGNNALFFHGGGGRIKGKVNILFNGLCYIGKNSSFNGVDIRVYEGKNLIFGDDVMFSWGIWLSPTDHHLIFDGNTYKRVNFGKSIYIGDHVWCGQEAAILKGSFAASGSILGAKSVNAGKKFSNSIYAGNPSKLIRENYFWSREEPGYGSWSREKIIELSIMQKDDYKFNFEKDKFLDPNLLEAELEKLETAGQKLEFVYDYIYNNTNKNRFALFKDSDRKSVSLYKDESKMPFSKLQFVSKPIGAVCLVKNYLSYKLGIVMIENSKSLKGYLKMPFKLYKISKEHKKLSKNQSRLEDFGDYQEALKYKNHLSYKLGNALINAHKNWYKGGYVKFYLEILKIKKRF
ncbi:TPA: hypothetical protein RTH03_000862 [Campylobacter jejuni]|nr:hypothetical protein [Campylobacter jejuni]HDZ5105654.1 hypothetical protein [Campylobacter jejuni]